MKLFMYVIICYTLVHILLYKIITFLKDDEKNKNNTNETNNQIKSNQIVCNNIIYIYSCTFSIDKQKKIK